MNGLLNDGFRFDFNVYVSTDLFRFFLFFRKTAAAKSKCKSGANKLPSNKKCVYSVYNVYCLSLMCDGINFYTKQLKQNEKKRGKIDGFYVCT